MIRGLAAFFFIIWGIWSCSADKSTGNSMETENSVAFQIWKEQGIPAALASIRIRPSDYLADTNGVIREDQGIISDKLNNKGYYIAKDLPKGRYLVEIQTDSGSGSLIEFEHFPQDSNRQHRIYESTLAKVGRLTGQIDLPADAPYAWVHVYGLEHVTRTDSLGVFHFDGLAPGYLHVMAWLPKSSLLLAQDLVEIGSDKTTQTGVLDIPEPGLEEPTSFAYSREIQPESLISDWMRPLAFPTVLTLRLDSSNFDFSQAQPQGNDLRIYDANDNLVPFEIRRWEPDLQRGVLRIRFENSNDTINPLTLLWGRERSAFSSSDVWAGIADSVRILMNAIHLDDFEKPSLLNALPEPIPHNYWYGVRTDSATFSLDTNNFVEIIEYESEARGNVVHLTFTAPAPQWVLTGTGLNASPRSLATLDSITLWLKGSGRFMVSLDYLGGKTKTWSGGYLDSTWQKIKIRPQDFLPADNNGGNVGWEAIKDSISNFNIFTYGEGESGNEVWIDDIWFYGISIDDLK